MDDAATTDTPTATATATAAAEAEKLQTATVEKRNATGEETKKNKTKQLHYRLKLCEFFA
jgi:hypothetical protein